jgi:hypothetical protein
MEGWLLNASMPQLAPSRSPTNAGYGDDSPRNQAPRCASPPGGGRGISGGLVEPNSDRPAIIGPIDPPCSTARSSREAQRLAEEALGESSA